MSINIDVSCELCGKKAKSDTLSVPDGFLPLFLGEPNKRPLRHFVLCAACSQKPLSLFDMATCAVVPHATVGEKT